MQNSSLYVNSIRLSMRNFFGFWLFCLIFMLAGTYFFLQKQFPAVDVLTLGYPQIHYRGKGEDPAVSIGRRRPPYWADLGQVSKYAIGAVIVSEDWAFFSHSGFDVNQIKESMEKNLAKGRFARGGSTITQQVVKNVFLESDKTIWRKVRELILALDLEQQLSKRKILEVYFNIAEWGEGIYGIRRAANHYFQKNPSELSPREGAFLAMLLPSPKKYSVSHRQGELTRFAQRRIHKILLNMRQAHYIDDAQYEAARAQRFSWERTYLDLPSAAEGEELETEEIEDGL